ncbi:alpha/beta hydrolase [Flavobacterium silvaticum]|uniref:Alpha/beta hydrolase n=1 Tax=Flavobacterium silvaticum TaxID=1852020 RepID=A0A972FP20_9FLAO|nr:alpha/beta hydrolase [Flavobacterium silvaticum]NMH26794.1 alpha/beta hydrolase [Flavobacterium silvaticum]
MKKIGIVLFLFVCARAFSQEVPTPDMVRQLISGDIKSLGIEPEKIFRTEDQKADGVPIRIYYPDASKKWNIIYNIHGGALVAGDLDTHENISRKLANAAHAIVISVDYRKAPENPFPKSLEDVETVYKWIIGNQIKIGGSDSKVSIVSDSGGSLLAAALQVKIKRDSVENKIDRVVYINPAFDLRNPGEDFYGLVTQWYLSGADASNELVSPIATGDFTVFAPCLIVVNEKDVLLPHGVVFGKKLDAAHVRNEIITVKDEDHFGGFWAGAHPKINAVFEKTIAFLTK